MLATILALIAEIAPAIGDVASIDKIITTLEGIVSTVTTEVQAVMPMIKNIIAALRSNGSITADQMTQLEALDAATDAAFEDAVTAAETN